MLSEAAQRWGAPPPPVVKDGRRWVYAFVDDLSGQVKIGRSANPCRRYRAISAHCPNDLRVLALLEVQDSWTAERCVHRALVAGHSHSEWFHATDAQVLAAMECARFDDSGRL